MGHLPRVGTALEGPSARSTMPVVTENPFRRACWSIAAAVAVTGVLIGAMGMMHWHALRAADTSASQRLINETRQLATAVGTAAASQMDGEGLTRLLGQLRDAGHLVSVSIINDEGLVVADASGAAAGTPAPLLSATSSMLTRAGLDTPLLERPFAPGEEIRRAYLRIAALPGRPVLCIDANDPIPTLNRDLRASLVAAVIAATAVGLGAGLATFAYLALRQRMETRLRQTERLAAAGALAAAIAHEVRNPLGLMLTSAEMLAASPSIDHQDRQLVFGIADEIERINDQVDAFLDLVRDPPLRLHDIDLAEILRVSLAPLRAQAQSRGIALDIDLLPTLPMRADDRRMRQLATNLVMNALDAAGQGGKVQLTLRRRPDDTAELQVADSGPGIPADRRQAVFEPFATTKPDGTGLGLSGSQRVVASHGGTIKLDDSPLGGARFTVSIPIRATGAAGVPCAS